MTPESGHRHLDLHNIHTPGESPAYWKWHLAVLTWYLLQIRSKRGAFSLANVVLIWGSTLRVSRVVQPPDLIVYALQQVKAGFAGSNTNRRLSV